MPFSVGEPINYTDNDPTIRIIPPSPDHHNFAFPPIMRSDLEEERIPLGRTSTSDEDEEEDDYPPPAQPDMRIENALKPRARNKLVVALLPATIILLLVIAIFKPIDVSSVVTSASELSSWKQASDVGPIEVHEGVEQRIVEWKGEDLKLREYKWGQHEPHASLVSLVQTLNEVRSQLLFSPSPASLTRPFSFFQSIV